MKPQRVRLSRRKGDRLPAGTVVVARPSRWGNAFKPGAPGVPNRTDAVRLYREDLARRPEVWPEIRRLLADKHLACWCPLDGPCHADVLLAVANADPREVAGLLG